MPNQVSWNPETVNKESPIKMLAEMLSEAGAIPVILAALPGWEWTMIEPIYVCSACGALLYSPRRRPRRCSQCGAGKICMERATEEDLNGPLEEL